MAPAGSVRMLRRGDGYHGIAFSADGHYVAFTRAGSPSSIEIVRVADGVVTFFLDNLRAPLKPKSIAFTSDHRFVMIAWSLNVGLRSNRGVQQGAISVHAFDAATGQMDSTPVTELQSPSAAVVGIDSCAMLPTPSNAVHHLVTGNQRLHTAHLFAFDTQTQSLQYVGPIAHGMSFAHGIAADASGRYVAVTCYGDDSLQVLRMLDRNS
jgi:hypothetical protein